MSPGPNQLWIPYFHIYQPLQSRRNQNLLQLNRKSAGLPFTPGTDIQYDGNLHVACVVGLKLGYFIPDWLVLCIVREYINCTYCMFKGLVLPSTWLCIATCVILWM